MKQKRRSTNIIVNQGRQVHRQDNPRMVAFPALYNDYIKTDWAADNIITGSGGGLLQVDANRDTQRFAIKAAAGERDHKSIDIHKAPKTDMSKASKSGHLKLHTPTMTISSSKETPAMFESYSDMLRTAYEDGNFYPQKFEDIIENAEKSKHYGDITRWVK